MELIDIGVNLTSKRFHADRTEVIQRARDAGVTRMIVTGTSIEESEAAAALCREYRGMLWSTAGVHPHHASTCTHDALQAISTLLSMPEVVAVGETGLDFNRDFSPRADQERAFAAQLELAARQGMPVFIHQRDAHPRLLAILREQRDALVDAVIHCFTDTREALYDYLDLDLHIGITGWICDDRRGGALRELVAHIPADRLMIETDAPYLLPKDLPVTPRNRRNEPAWLPHVLATVARCRGCATEDLAVATTLNALRFFRLGAATEAARSSGRFPGT